MKKIKSITAVTLAFIAGLEVGLAAAAYSVMWAAESIKQDLEPRRKPVNYSSYRDRHYEE